MSTPHGQGGGGRASKPPAPVVPTNTLDLDWSNGTPIQVKHGTARSDPATAANQTQNPFTNHRLTEQAHAVRPARQNMSSFVGGNPPPSAPNAPSAMRKRGPSSVADAPAQRDAERAAKRPANASTRSDLASGDAAVAHGGTFVGNTNERPASEEGELLDSMSPGAVEVDAAGMGMEPAYVKSEQASAGRMRNLAGENYRNVASTRAPMMDGPWARPRNDSMDRSVHGAYRQTQSGFSPGANGMECRACGSQCHKTKECHVPSSDGTVVICPFHNYTVRDQAAKQDHTRNQDHSLDGHRDYAPADRVKIPLYCETVMKYKAAVRDGHTPKIRKMLFELFRELVINRRRKPCCRVVNRVVCPINLTIQYSVAFCRGQMPVELEGMWPYTMRDATNPAIIAELELFDELGRERMPPGELEEMSWEQIKSEYARGKIPPQIHSKQRPLYLPSTSMSPAAEFGDTEAHLPNAVVEPQAVYEDGDGQSSLVREGAVQSQDPAKMDDVIQMLGVLSEKFDEKFDALAKKLDEKLDEKFDAIAEKLDEKADANSGQVAALSQQVATNSEQVAALSEKKKDFLYKILDSLP